MEEHSEVLGKKYIVPILGRTLGKTQSVLIALQRFMETLPEELPESRKVLIVGLGTQSQLSKEMVLLLEVVKEKGIEIVFNNSIGPSTLISLSKDKFEGLRTSTFDIDKILNNKRIEPVEMIKEFTEPKLHNSPIPPPKIKNNPIVGKSSKKGKSSTESKYHK